MLNTFYDDMNACGSGISFLVCKYCTNKLYNSVSFIAEQNKELFPEVCHIILMRMRSRNAEVSEIATKGCYKRQGEL